MVMVWTARALTESEHAAIMAEPGGIPELLEEPPEEAWRELELDTSWHGLHYLLTGSAYESHTAAGKALLGGDPVGTDLGGHGPAHLIEVRDVRRIAKALERIRSQDLAHRLEPEAMVEADIYPGFWHEPDIFEDYLRPAYRGLRRFYRRAAGLRQPVLTAIH